MKMNWTFGGCLAGNKFTQHDFLGTVSALIRISIHRVYSFALRSGGYISLPENYIKNWHFVLIIIIAFAFIQVLISL